MFFWMINIGNYRESFLKLFCMEFKLRKCFFLQKFNDKKIISLRPVEYHFQYSLNWSRMSFHRQSVLS